MIVYFYDIAPTPPPHPHRTSCRQANLFASILTFWKRKWNLSRTALFVCFFVGGGLESTPLSSCIYKKVVFLNAIIVDFVESVANQHLCTSIYFHSFLWLILILPRTLLHYSKQPCLEMQHLKMYLNWVSSFVFYTSRYFHWFLWNFYFWNYW